MLVHAAPQAGVLVGVVTVGVGVLVRVGVADAAVGTSVAGHTRLNANLTPEERLEVLQENCVKRLPVSRCTPFGLPVVPDV